MSYESTGEVIMVDFIDAYNISYLKARGLKEIATFDIKHFKGAEDVMMF